jgi:hypothetical protein
MYSFVPLLALFSVSSVTPVTASVADCSAGKSLFRLTSMSFSPDPTVPGQNSTLLLSMKIPEEINNGTATYTSTYNFIPLTPSTDDLCGTTVNCPIGEGYLDTLSSFPIDKSLTGSLTLKIVWADLTGRQLLCVMIKTKLGDAAKQVALPYKVQRSNALRGNRTRSHKKRKHRNHKAHLAHKALVARSKCLLLNNWANASLAAASCP